MLHTGQQFYHAVRDRAERLAEQEESEEANTRSRRYGDTSFYWLLGVAQDARLSTIQRALSQYAPIIDQLHGELAAAGGTDERLSELNLFMSGLRAKREGQRKVSRP